MTELYVFRGTVGNAETVTVDKSGVKLPPHPFGNWVFSRTIDFNADTRLIGGSIAARCSPMSPRMGITIGRNWIPTSPRPRPIVALEILM